MQDWVGWLDILHLVVVVGVSELAVMVVVVWVSESSVGSELVELVMCQVRLGELRLGSELVELVTCQVRLVCAALKFFFSPKKIFTPRGPNHIRVKSGWLVQPSNFFSHPKHFHPPRAKPHTCQVRLACLALKFFFSPKRNFTPRAQTTCLILVQLGVSHKQTSGDSSFQRKTEMPINKNSKNQKLDNSKSGKNKKEQNDNKSKHRKIKT
jgi:hypothetical protein